jgi:NAD dependent epimerase/dehydratase family
MRRCVLYPCNLYGPYDAFDPEKSHVVSALIKKVHLAKKRQSPYLDLLGTGRPRRQCLYVADVARVIAAVVQLRLEGHFNVAIPDNPTVDQIAEIVQDVVGYLVPRRYSGTLDGQSRKGRIQRRPAEPSSLVRIHAPPRRGQGYVRMVSPQRYVERRVMITGIPEALAGRCAVVIASCDAYSETWKPYEILLEKFWPECPFRVYLMSNEAVFSSPRMTNILVGTDASWSSNLAVVLAKIPEEYVILMVDDCFFTRAVPSARIVEILQWTEVSGANCVHLFGRPRPAVQTTSLVGPLPPGTYYRVSAVSALWRKTILLSILAPGETAWDFEIRGSVRSDAFDGFYSTLRPCFSFINGIIKGKWHPRSLAALRKLDVAPDWRKRGLLSMKQRATLMLVLIRSRALCLLPLRIRWKVKAFALRGRFKYQRDE